MGLYLWQMLSDFVHRRPSTYDYAPLTNSPAPVLEMATFEDPRGESKPPSPSQSRLPFRRIWTRNVVFTLLTSAVFDFHMGAFNNLWSLFLSTPRSVVPSSDEKHGAVRLFLRSVFQRSDDVPINAKSDQPLSHAAKTLRSLPFNFTGGLGMPPSSIGFATSIIGLLGMAMQLTLYPAIHARLGTLRSFRLFLLLFPVAYFLAPYLAVLPSSSIPSTTENPTQATGIVVWIGITFVLFCQVLARTFALPATIMLINNCSPHPSVLGTVHGLGMSVSSAARTVGPVVAGVWYGRGLNVGVVGLAWWGVAVVAALGCVTATWVYEGSGHEIFLPGERGGPESDDRLQAEELEAGAGGYFPEDAELLGAFDGVEEERGTVEKHNLQGGRQWDGRHLSSGRGASMDILVEMPSPAPSPGFVKQPWGLYRSTTS